MAGSFQPPASWKAWVEAPRAVSSTARPTRPPCDVLRPFEAGRGAGGGEAAVDLIDAEVDDGIVRCW